VTPIDGVPEEYLERARALYIAEVETAARQCMSGERAALFLKLLKLTSLGRVRLDVTAQLSKLQSEPDLRDLTQDQLAAIMRGEAPLELEALPASDQSSKP
jgi:hypothetical protein